MNPKKLIIFVLVVAALGAIYAFGAGSKDNDIPNDAETKLRDAYTFSNTMEWDPSLYAKLGETLNFQTDWEEKISLPDPPANSSAETRQELDTLLSYKSLRTDQKLLEINQELLVDSAEFGGQAFSAYLNPVTHPATNELLAETLYDITVVVLQYKQQFDRVRPHILEPDLEPVITVPGHPAYPSGHSTQAHFLALLLGEVIPEKKSQFWESAERIAKNREIAGVHYPSDSEAGVMLAEQYFDLLKDLPEIQALVAQARAEWVN